jgi:nitroreductase
MREQTIGRRAGAWWHGPRGEPGPVLRVCLRAAVAAPSVHNTQPWRFQPRRHGVDVYADLDRQLAVIDPTGREMLLSVGAAMFNLRVALRAHGRVPAQLLHPTPHVPGLMGRISPGPAAAVPHTARALAWAIPRRRSNRWPFADLAPPREVLADLTRAAGTEGATLRILGRDACRNVLGLVRSAEQEWREDLAYRNELARWTLAASSDRRDGVPSAAIGPRVPAGGLPLRDLALALPNLRRKEARFEPTPTIAVLYGDDSLEHWLRAGQALQRTLLTATNYGVATTLLSQPLEIPRLRALLSDPYTGQPAQAIVRFGYSRRPAAASPRRPLAEVVAQRTGAFSAAA